MKSTFETLGGTYRQEGVYLLPNMVSQLSHIRNGVLSSTIHEKSELLHDRKCVRIFCLYQRHYILMLKPRGFHHPLGIFVLSALFRQRILLCHHEARHHLQTEQPWIETLNDGSFLGISFDIPSLVLF